MDSFIGDADVRGALRKRLVIQNARHSDTVILDELGICRGQVRADIAVVNGKLHGFEIKSDKDSLRRLAGQIDLYNKVFDCVTVVTGKRHLSGIMDSVPDWWGILLAEQGRQIPRFQPIRRGLRNRNVDPRCLVEFLWHEHAIALLEQRNVARGVRGKPRDVVWDRVCENFSVGEIAAVVRSHLKARAMNPGLA